MSIVASSNIDSFEIKELHQLFQANYLISVGDYKSALHSFYELNSLLENNKHLWSTPRFITCLPWRACWTVCAACAIMRYELFLGQLKKLKTLPIQHECSCLVFWTSYSKLTKEDFAELSSSWKIIHTLIIAQAAQTVQHALQGKQVINRWCRPEMFVVLSNNSVHRKNAAPICNHRR